jgi:hypothetical protein
MNIMITESETVRKNVEIEAAVNRGLAAALLSDRSVGAKIMRDAGVPNHVITRVLMGSHVVHRSSDWKKE